MFIKEERLLKIHAGKKNENYLLSSEYQPLQKNWMNDSSNELNP